MRGVRAAPREGLTGIERVVFLKCAGLFCFFKKESELVLIDWCLRAAAVGWVGGGSLELSGTYMILRRRHCQREVNSLGG